MLVATCWLVARQVGAMRWRSSSKGAWEGEREERRWWRSDSETVLQVSSKLKSICREEEGR